MVVVVVVPILKILINCSSEGEEFRRWRHAEIYGPLDFYAHFYAQLFDR